MPVWHLPSVVGPVFAKDVNRGVSAFFVCPPTGFELLYQPEVVRLYLSLLTESQNYNTLEAAAGALQNLSAGQWMVSPKQTDCFVRQSVHLL